MIREGDRVVKMCCHSGALTRDKKKAVGQPCGPS